MIRFSRSQRRVQDAYHGKHALAVPRESTPALLRAAPLMLACTLVLVALFVVFMALSPTYVSNVLGSRALFANAVDLDVQEDVVPHAQIVYRAANVEAVGRQDTGRSQACYGYSFAYADTITSGEVHTWKEYAHSGETEADFVGKLMRETYDAYEADDEQAALRTLYMAITEGKPVVLHVNLASGGEHWVTVVGFRDVLNLGALSLGNFLMLDPAGAEGAAPEVLDCRGYTLFEGDDATMYISHAASAIAHGEQVVLHEFGSRVVQSGGTTQWNRLFGSNALDTMATIADEGFPVCETVILAANSGYWDALAASGLAGIYNCPVLLTQTETLSPQARYEIERLKATQVVIVGGTASVGQDVERALVDDLHVAVTRLAGENAMETALAVQAEGGIRWGETAIVATANSYHDALAIAPYAYAKRAPVFLASGVRGQLDADSYQAVEQFAHVVIAGGTESVASAVEVQLKQDDVDAVRLAGDNAYATSLAVAQWCVEQGMTANDMGVATGAGYWDALAAGAFCGKRGSVLVLAADENTMVVDGFVKANASRMARAWVFGGEASVSADVFSQLVLATAQGE